LIDPAERLVVYKNLFIFQAVVVLDRKMRINF